MKIRTPFNSKEFKKNYEVNDEPSMTIPDQTMSITEILRRYASGLPISGEKVPIYHDEEDLPEWKTLDLSEKQELKDQIAEDIRQYQVALQEQERKRKKEAAEKIIQKRKQQDNDKATKPVHTRTGDDD